MSKVWPQNCASMLPSNDLVYYICALFLGSVVHAVLKHCKVLYVGNYSNLVFALYHTRYPSLLVISV